MITLTTGYRLPFEVSVSSGRLLSVGNDIGLAFQIPGSTEAELELVAAIVEAFAQIAVSGALCGESINPGESGLTAQSESSGLRFTFAGCRIDEAALIVLVNLILAKSSDIGFQTIEITRSQLPAGNMLEYADSDQLSFPAVYGSLPFVLENQLPESGGFTFTARTVGPVNEQNVICLNKYLNAWLVTVNGGGYALPPISPMNCYAESADDEVTWFEDLIEWTVFKLRADDAAITAVINIFAAFHARFQNLVSLRIS